MSRTLTVEVEALQLIVTYDPVTGHFWPIKSRGGCRKGQPLGCREPNGYRRIMIERRRYLAHRLAWFYVTGEWPSRDIDHRNMSRDDNSWENLRLATDSQNHANTKAVPGSKSGLKGAHWNANRNYWQSYIRVNGRSRFLGRFSTAEDAHRAYVVAAKELHGEFARAA